MTKKTPISVIDDVFEAHDRFLEKGMTIQGKEIGIVQSVGEGIARVNGLPNVKTDELLKFSNGALGLTYNLDPTEVGIILLDEEHGIEAGHEVNRTHRILSVPVGDALLGRELDPLGRPLDNKGPIHASKNLPIERPAPPIMHRASVEEPLQTGILVIDSVIPIGRGQRELILGDRQSGKTAIAVDAIINQKDKDVICIYCAIGKQRAAVNRVISELRNNDAMEYTIVVSATSSKPTGLQYIAPYSATSMAEYFMEKGRDVLIVYDDLTWHARAYREIALLLRRPPGREAYPGDIFYIHARLLERATNLKPQYGGGSLTALPIIETQAQHISAFIPTNLISISDGQIYLSPTLFQKGVLPAVDIGRSVSRVGSAAQLPVYRKVAKELKLAYAQFEEIESFARFSSHLDDSTRKLITRGERIREVLKQSQFDAQSVIEQIELLRAVNTGQLDAVPLDKVDKAKKIIRKIVMELPEDVRRKINEGFELEDIEREQLDESIHTALENLKEKTTPQ